jgi:ferredoxin-type protein NapH
MSRFLYKHRILFLRRFVQISLLFLYFSANAYGWKVLTGTLSSSTLFGVIPLSDPFALLQMFAAGALLAMDAIIGALIIVLFYAVIGGRAFCSWVCPINMVTDLANWLRRVLYLDKIERKVWLSRNVRYWILGLTLVISVAMGVAAFEFVSPISMFHRGVVFGLGMGSTAIISIFLFDLFAVKNGWCGHICPLGGFYSLVGKYSFIRVKHNQPNCTLCMKCKDVCPEKHVLHMIGKSSESVNSGECTNCGRCVEVCDDDALNFGIRDYIKKNG